MISHQTYAAVLVLLTVIIAALVAILVYAALRFGAAARAARHSLRDESPDERTFMAAALQEAISRLREKERELALLHDREKARADESERLSGEVINSMTAGMIVVDPSRAITAMNPAARRLLRLTGAKAGEPLSSLPPWVGPLVAVIGQCIETRQPIVRQTLELHRERERTTHLGLTVSPLYGANEMFRGALCLFTDLTTEVELEAQLRLKESLARLGELIAGIAHEFRNGLATILGYSRLLSHADLPLQARTYAEGIRAETDALSQVVSNFLNFAKPAALQVAQVDLRALVERTADEAATEVSGRGGSVEITGPFGTLRGDEVLLRQAFSNLLRNAVDACSALGVPPRIRIIDPDEEQRDVVHLKIEDNGGGIASENLDRVFQPFFTTRPEGTGLGLAIVQKIVVSHNGRIWPEPMPEGGTRFHVLLPRRPDGPA